jgi:hypothetical protein
MSLGVHAPRSAQCAVCMKPYLVLRMGQKVCGPKCAVKFAKSVRARGAKELRERKKALETIPELLKEAQREFNSFIRARDRAAGLPCISSGRPLDWSGNAVDAGHYRSVGAAPHLRFDERNCHAQSKHDNQYRAGNVVEYRINLVKRIGLEAVEALEADNRVHKWTREELREIAAHYRMRRKELEKGQ